MSEDDKIPKLETVPTVGDEKTHLEDERIANDVDKFRLLFEKMKETGAKHDIIIISGEVFDKVIKPQLVKLRTSVQKDEVVVLTANGPIFLFDVFCLNIKIKKSRMTVSTAWSGPNEVKLKFSKGQNPYRVEAYQLNGAQLMWLFGFNKTLHPWL